MKKIVTALLLTALTLGIHMPGIASEYAELTNGDFSQGTAEWNVVNADLTAESQQGTGDVCGKVVMKEAYGRAMHKFTFERNVTYFISINVRLDRGRDTANLVVDHRSFGDKNMILSVAKGVNVSENWAKLTGKYVWNGEGTGEAQIYVRVGGALEPITYYIDNLVIEKYSGGVAFNKADSADENELIYNFGFNGSTDGYITRGARINAVSGGVNNTAYAARVQSDSASSFVGQKLYLEQNSKYEISAYIKAEKGTLRADTIVIYPESAYIAEDGYVRDYSFSSVNTEAYLPTGGGTVSNEWKLIKGEYIHTGLSKEVLVGIAPYMEKGNTFLIDNLSVIKKGSAEKIEESTSLAGGIIVNGTYSADSSWFTIKDGYAVGNAEKLAELLGAEYKNGIMSKGFDILELNPKDGCASVNGRMIAVRELYKQGNLIFVDFEAVCRSFGASFKINGDTVEIQTKKENKALSNMAESLIKDKEASVAFIGGGVAYGRGAGVTNKTSYRSLVMKWLRNKFSDCNISELNNTYWYGNSEYAAYDIERLINNSPDVVFIDFAPEDSENAYEMVVNNIESIVYKIKKESPKTDVVILITYTNDLSAAYAEGGEHEVVTAYNTVAQKYGLTVVDINRFFVDEMAANKQNPQDFMTYMYFPNDNGHRMYAECVCEFMENALKTPAAPEKSEIPKVYGIIDGKMSEIVNHGTFTKEDGFVSGNPGNSLEFEFSGNTIGVVWESGIDTGAVDVEIDGVNEGTFYAFDFFGVRKTKLYYTVFAKDLSDGVHTIKLTVSDKKHKMSLGNRVKISKFIVGNTLH